MSDEYRSNISEENDHVSDGASSLNASAYDDQDAIRRRSSVHTAAALDIVDDGRRRQRTMATRSIRYAQHIDAVPSPGPRVYSTPRPHSGRQSSALPFMAASRPGTAASAAALTGLVPTNGDRLKHLQSHMEQLQQLYAQEIHKEELARREAFVQSMCTSSITLWRYVSSKPRFFTAVKALVTQYLPANDARLYEVEEPTEGDLFLVLGDGRTVTVNGYDGIGVVGRAVHATSQLSTTQWTAIQKQVSEHIGEAGASMSSSVSSSTRSTSTTGYDAQASRTRWLDHHVDCILPSANDHLFILLPLDRVYRDSGFNPEIDLSLKKRDLYESSTTKQLLVLVLRDANQHPIGALEALVTTRKPLQIDFLDAFASLLVAALDARRSICRPSVGPDLCIDIVSQDESQLDPACPGTVTLDLVPGTKLILKGGTSVQRGETDMPLLEAVRKPMATLFTQVQQWQECAKRQTVMIRVAHEFWMTVVTLAVEFGLRDDDGRESLIRPQLRTAIQKLGVDSSPSVSFRVLFDGQTLEQFQAANETCEALDGLSPEGQFAALERAIRLNETFTSTPLVTVIPVVTGELRAAVLVLRDDVNGEEESTQMFVELVVKAVELVLMTESYENERGVARVEINLVRDALQQQEDRVWECEFVLRLDEGLMECQSMEAIVAVVNRCDETEDNSSSLPKMTLFIAEYEDKAEVNAVEEEVVVRCIWTIRKDKEGDRVMVFERDNVQSPSCGAKREGGLAAVVLASGEQLMYTPQHAAYDPIVRQKIAQAASHDLFYVALPIRHTPSARVLGVLEVALESEERQKQFADSALASSIASSVTQSMVLHDWIATNKDTRRREVADLKEIQMATWERWRTFVASLREMSATTTDLADWRTTVETHLKILIPSVTHANVLVRTNDDKLIEAVLQELNESGTSVSLNLYNHAVLGSVWTTLLEDHGVLVLGNATTSTTLEPLNVEISHFGPLAAQLVVVELNHRIARQQQIVKIESLRATLVDVERTGSHEQSLKKILERRLAQQSVVLHINRLMKRVPEINSIDELVMTILGAVAYLDREIQASLVVANAEGDTDGQGWSDACRSCVRLSRREIEWMTSSTQSLILYSAPFCASQTNFIQRMWPSDQVNDRGQLVVTRLTEAPHDEDASAHVSTFVLLLPDDMEDGDVFAVDLASAVDRVVLLWNHQQHSRHLQEQYDAAVRGLSLSQDELKTVITHHNRWTAMWSDVLRQLWTGLSEEDTTASQKQLLVFVQKYLEELLAAEDKTCEVRIVSDSQSDEEVLQTVLSEWMSPPDMRRFLSQPRRSQGMLETRGLGGFCGNLQDQVLALYWTTEHQVSSVVAVRFSEPINSDAMLQSFEILLAKASEVVVLVGNVFTLNDQVCASTTTNAELTGQLDEMKEQLARATEVASHRTVIGRVLTTLLDRRTDDMPFDEVFHTIPGHCLWMRDRNDPTMLSTLGDDTKRTRPTNLQDTSHTAGIHVDGDRVGTLEVMNDSCEEELTLVAAVVSSTLAYRALQRQLDDLETEVERNSTAITTRQEEQARRRDKLICQWHRMNAMLCELNAVMSTSWSEILVQVEETMLRALTELTGVRLVVVDVNVKTQEIVSDLSSTATHCLSMALGLWTMNDEKPDYRRTKVLSTEEENVRQFMKYLFPTRTDLGDTKLILLSAMAVPANATMHRAYTVLVGLVSPAIESLSVDVLHAIEMNLRSVATAYEQGRLHEKTRRRAVEVEMRAVASEAQCTETQQWVTFLEKTQYEAQRLVQTALVIEPTDSGERLWVRQVEAFVQALCACEAIELYDVVLDDASGERRCLLTTHGAALSPSARSCEFAKALDALVNTTGASSSSVETTSTGHRLVSAVRSLPSDVVMAVLVIYWKAEAAPSTPTVEMVDTIVCPWLATMFSIAHERETYQLAQDASIRDITTLKLEKSELEVQGLQLKHHLSQAEQRNASLQDNLQMATELFKQLETSITSVATIVDVSALWTMLTRQLASLRCIYGVQLCEGTEGSEPTMILSTFSNAEDTLLRESTRTSGENGLVQRCFASQQSQECRVTLSSAEYKRVRVVPLGSIDRLRCVVVIFTSDNRTTHQLLELVDRFVAICVSIGTNRVAEIERMEVQTATSNALETAMQDLTMQLEHERNDLVCAQFKLGWWKALHGQLGVDILGHEVWRSFDKMTGSSATIATTKLTMVWHYLQETAKRRLQEALSTRDDLTVQLYGVVKTSSTIPSGFVFSLPSVSSDCPPRKGFFCVALSQLEQRREWRKMAQCIRSAKQIPRDGWDGGGDSVLFPVRRVVSKERKLVDSTETIDIDEEEICSSADTGHTVGVLLVRRRDQVALQGTLGAVFHSLVQAFVDALAPRVDAIGQLVSNKQQNPTTTQPTTTQTTKNPHPGEGDIINLMGTTQDLRDMSMPMRSHTKANDTGSNIQRTRHASRSNQDDQAENDVDSEEEREAERVRDRRRLSITTNVLDFVLRVQAGQTERNDRDAALRVWVNRELKSVWCGDERKHRLATIELFYVVDGVVRDRLDGSVPTTTAPTWVTEFAEGTLRRATMDAFRLWKIDAVRWIVSTNVADDVVLLVVMGGSCALENVFDNEDQQMHLPALLRALGAEASRIMEAIVQRSDQCEQEQKKKKRAAERDDAWQQQCDELARRLSLENELADLTMRLQRMSDEQNVIQTAVDGTQRFLNCPQVSFRPVTSTSSIQSELLEHDEMSAIMETVLRVHVASSSGEVLGTLVARLNDHDRGGVLSSDSETWTIRLVERLADTTATVLLRLREQNLLRQAEKSLASALEALETQQRELVALNDTNESLEQQIGTFEEENKRLQRVDQENERLRNQLEELDETLVVRETTEARMMQQVKQYETQLIEVNSQLEQSIKAETQLLRLEEAFAVSQSHQARLERKYLKQKLQLKQLITERSTRHEQDERAQAELTELRRQVAVLREKQQHRNSGGGMDASGVAAAMLQAQAQAMAQTQAIQQSHHDAKHQQQRLQSVAQRRVVRQLQWQQQVQKRKQLDLAQELRQLTALEVQEMNRRPPMSPGKTMAMPQVHEVRTATIPRELPVPSKLRSPQIHVPKNTQ